MALNPPRSLEHRGMKSRTRASGMLEGRGSLGNLGRIHKIREQGIGDEKAYDEAKTISLTRFVWCHLMVRGHLG